MTAPLNAPSTDTPTTYRRWLAEPLLHFLVLGAVLFALDHLLLAQRGDPRRIEVPDTAYEEARALVGDSLKREPTDRDLKVLIDRWIDNEVLYREGLRMGLDKGDSAIRDRVIFKALSVVQADLPTPELDEPALRKWFEAHRSRYDTPARYDFLEAVISGTHTEAALRAFVESLNGKGSPTIESSLSVFKDRPQPNIEQSYGPQFLQGLQGAVAQGSWLLLPSTTGPRVVRLLEAKAGAAADFNALRSDVLKDWRNEALAKVTTDAVRSLAGEYRVVRREDRR